MTGALSAPGTPIAFRPAMPRLPPRAARAVSVLSQAVVHYVRHQSANQAGSIAFSTVLAMFPLLLLVATVAASLGQAEDAQALALRILEYAPPLVRQALRPSVDQLLQRQNQALLAVGLLVTLWTASSGMQAIRTALNKAYGVEQGLAFWKARIKVTVFTLVTGSVVLVAFSSVIVMPYAWTLLQASAAGEPPAWLWVGVRYGVAYLVLAVLYAWLYSALPDVPQRPASVLPGALLGAALWLGAAALLFQMLRGAGKLELLYGGFAGVVATLVFIYASASTLIFGAELNGVLNRRPPA